MIDPETLALARLAPVQRAGRAHQPLEDLGEMAGMQDDQAHALPDALGDALDDLVVDRAVILVAPPEQHVGLGQPLSLRPCSGSCSVAVVASMPTSVFSAAAIVLCMPFGIDLPHDRVGLLVDVLAPDDCPDGHDGNPLPRFMRSND